MNLYRNSLNRRLSDSITVSETAEKWGIHGNHVPNPPTPFAVLPGRPELIAISPTKALLQEVPSDA